MRAVSFAATSTPRGRRRRGLGLRRTLHRITQLVRLTWPLPAARRRWRSSPCCCRPPPRIAGPLIVRDAINNGIEPHDLAALELWVALFLVVVVIGWRGRSRSRATSPRGSASGC